jgi:hypothetical protein
MPRPEGFDMKDKSNPQILFRLLLFASMEVSKKQVEYSLFTLGAALVLLPNPWADFCLL